MSKFTGCWFPAAQTIEENGAIRIAHSFEAANEKQARAKATLLFMEEFPDADDSLFELRIYLNAEGIPCPSDEWDETFLFDHEWDEELGQPVAKSQAKPVEFEKLSPTMQLCSLVKYRSTKIYSDQLPAALELTQDDAATFEGHIVEAITKMPAVASMYPGRILEAIEYICEKCPSTKKWPEIKAVLAGWIKQHEAERKDGGVEAASNDDVKPGSGDPDRFDLVLALLVMGKEPAKAGATDVKNAKHIKDARDPAWRSWRTSLLAVPGIYHFPEHLLYELTLDGMKDLSLIADSVGRRDYIREYFAGHPLLPDFPVEETESETEQNETSTTRVLADDATETGSVEHDQLNDEAATGPLETSPSVERTGPFYYRTVDGQVGRANKQAKLEAVIEQGCEEITKEEYQALKDSPPPQQQKTSSDQPEVRNLGDGRYTIDGLASDQPQIDTKNASNEVEKTEVVSQQPASPAFQSIAAALETDLAEKGDNLKIWRSVMRTDPRYTKALAGAGFEGTSINAEYMIMRATEIFGPIGTGWGFEVLEDRMIPGAPMSEAIYDDKKFIGNRMLRDGDGTLITELNHSIKIAFWYLTETGAAERFEAYGATPYMYKTKSGIRCDGEAQKKSLTDAIKKALSLLGFSADVWLGLYDQAEYQQENAIEFDIRNASDKAEDVTRIRKELDEKFKLNTESMRTAVTPNEISGIASSLTRVMGVHLKAAREKADPEYTKYLEGRLRRLEEVKSECLTKLQEQAA
jgi:hypothetical protein